MMLPRVTKDSLHRMSVRRRSGQPSGSGRRGAAGFTTVELLTVVAILVILVAITVIGFRFVGDRAKGNTVQVTLESLRGMLQEADSAGLLRRQPPGLFQSDNVWVRIDPDGNGPYNNGLIPDLWRRHDVSVQSAASVAIWSPGNVTAARLPSAWADFDLSASGDGANNWRDAPAIKNTALALAMLRTVPGVAKSLDSLPNSVTRIPEFYSSSSPYSRGQRVIFRQNNNASLFTGPAAVYVAQRDLAPGIAPTPGSDNTDWARDFGAILDSFGNPILFVPASGLHLGTRYSASRSYAPGDRVFTAAGTARSYFECVAQTTPGTSPANTSFWRPAQPVRSPDGKPFWASAGPDGDFDTPADNLYSFEN